MLVRCTTIDVRTLEARHGTGSLWFSQAGSVALRPGKSYLVFAVVVHGGTTLVYLIDEDETAYPVPYPAELFAVVDPRGPEFACVFDQYEQSGKTELEVRFSFVEWAKDRLFYERLIDGDARHLLPTLYSRCER